MRTLIPVKDYPDLARDTNTGMIVNINKDKHTQHLNMVERIKKDKNEISSLKSEVQEMKIMLHQLLENGSNG
tara:strand:+ start:2697 stop:2912 length:216 start_codon:yes stop_codon:yes gene_type:complete